MDDLGRRGRGRLVLRALAILGALGFLTLVMVQAMAFYAPPKPPAATRHEMLGYPTKSAPVVRPPRLDQPEPEPPPYDRRLLQPATKAGTLGPLRVSPQPAARPPQQQGTRLPRE